MSLYTKRERIENALRTAVFNAREAQERAGFALHHAQTALDLLTKRQPKEWKRRAKP